MIGKSKRNQAPDGYAVTGVDDRVERHIGCLCRCIGEFQGFPGPRDLGHDRRMRHGNRFTAGCRVGLGGRAFQ